MRSCYECNRQEITKPHQVAGERGKGGQGPQHTSASIRLASTAASPPALQANHYAVCQPAMRRRGKASRICTQTEITCSYPHTPLPALFPHPSVPKTTSKAAATTHVRQPQHTACTTCSDVYFPRSTPSVDPSNVWPAILI
jgi:hypothetical protein